MKLSPIAVPYRAFKRASSVIFMAVLAASSGATADFMAPLAIAGLAVAAVVAVIGYEVAYYRRFEYEFTGDTLDITSGVVSRRERELPYHRIQNVDVTRNIVPRLLGIASVGIETAGGSQTEGSIQYVSAAEADRLQREIERRKRGAETTATSEEATAAEEELFALSPSELGLAGVLSFDPRVAGILTLVGPGSIPVLGGLGADLSLSVVAVALLGGATLVIAAWVLGAGVTIINYYGFRLVRTGDEFRYERGLIRRYSGSIPRSKVQSITVEDNPLKRLFGYATLTVETAGYAPGGAGGRGSQVAVPIARADRVRSLARDVEPFGDPSFERPPGRVRRRYVIRYLLALGAITAVVGAAVAWFSIQAPWYAIALLAPLALPAAHLKWRHRGAWTGPDHVVTRNGVWRRATKIVPYYRVQTVVDSRTVFQRRYGLATLTIDTAGSVSILGRDAAAVDVASEDAVDLTEILGQRLNAALRERRRTTARGS